MSWDVYALGALFFILSVVVVPSLWSSSDSLREVWERLRRGK